MGKRKSAKKPQVRSARTQPLDKSFRCPFCAHPGTISVKMDSVAKLGRLTCSNCDQGYESPITHLSEPVDVYTDWLDDAAEANKKILEEELGPPPAAKRRRVEEPEDEEDEDADLPEDGPQRRDSPAAAPARRPLHDDDDDDDDDDDEDLPPDGQ